MKKHFLVKIVFLSFVLIAAFGALLIWSEFVKAQVPPPPTLYKCSAGACVADPSGSFTEPTCGGTCTIIPPPPPPTTLYKCSAGACVADPSGSFTDSTCGGTCTVPPPPPPPTTGTLVISKITQGGDGTFNYTVSGPSSVPAQTITTISGVGGAIIQNVTAGTYTVTEGSLPAGWFSVGNTQQTVVVPAGGTGTVWFQNEAHGDLTITKNIVGGGPRPISFSFNILGPSSAPMQTITITNGSTGSVTIPNIIAGPYEITEVPAGLLWNNGVGPTQQPQNPVTVPINGTGTVTFTNTYTVGTITIKKTVNNPSPPYDPSFMFTTNLPPPPSSSFNLYHDQSVTFSTVPNSMNNIPYTITEVSPVAPTPLNPIPAWLLTDIICTGQSNSTVTPNPTNIPITDSFGNTIPPYSVSIILKNQENITCEFKNDINPPPPPVVTTLTLRKTVNGGSAQPSAWILTATGPNTISGPGPTVSGSVTPGTYSLSESGGPGPDYYTAGPWSCYNGPTLINNHQPFVTIQSGQSIECIIINTATGILRIEKYTDPETNGETFSYQVNNQQGNVVASPSLTTGNPNIQGQDGTGYVEISLPSGSYSIEETGLPANWILDSASCDPNFNIYPDQTTTCTFENKAKAHLILIKNVYPPTQGDSFGYTIVGPSGGGANVTTGVSNSPNGLCPNVLPDGQGCTELTVDPGTYNSITENVGAEWKLDNASCSSPGSYAELPQNRVRNIVINPGDIITCTFENTKKGKLRIEKNTIGSDGSFRFQYANNATPPTVTGSRTITTNNNQGFTTVLLDPGGYTLQEIVPFGWNLVSDSCNGAFTITAGQTTTCTFKNSDSPVINNNECINSQCVQCADPLNCAGNCQTVGQQCTAPPTGFACISNMCIPMPGGTQTGCFFSLQGCTPQNTGWECNNNQCQQSNSGTQTGCTSTGQYCAPRTGFSCINNLCRLDPYGVQTGCSPIGQCAPQPTGWECNNNQCQQSATGTQTSCLNVGQFCPGTPTGWSCVNNQCQQNTSGTQTGCSNVGQGCTPQPTGWSCVNNMCQIDSSGIQTTCSVVGQGCTPQPTGWSCLNFACVQDPNGIQSGCSNAGQQCTPQPTGFICVANMCMLSASGTQTGCLMVGQGCLPQPTGWTCNNNQCQQSSAGTQSGCSTTGQQCTPQPTGWACINNTCALNPFGIQTGCSAGQSCTPQPTGWSCVNNTCQQDPNGSQTGCGGAGQQCTPQPTGWACINNQCQQSASGSQTGCGGVGQQCTPQPTGWICSNLQCIQSSTGTQTGCSTNGQSCNPQPTGWACINNTCQQDPNGSQTGCSNPGQSCSPQPTGWTCSNNQCQQSSSGTQTGCTSAGQSCTPPGYQCVNNTCQTCPNSCCNNDCTGPGASCTPPQLKGNLTIVVTTSGGDGSFGFGTVGVTTSGGTGSATVNDIPVGFKTVSGSGNSRFTLTSASCDKPGRGALSFIDIFANDAIVDTFIEPNQTTTCTFNYTSGSLKIIVNTIGGDGEFNFIVADGTIVYTPYASTTNVGYATITTSGGTGSSQTIGPLALGRRYSVAEGLAPTYWSCVDSMCTPNTNGIWACGGYDVFGNCTASYYIGGPGIQLGCNATGDACTPSARDVRTPGFSLISETCNTSPGINISSGQTTTCTFTYGKQSTLKITQNTSEGDGLFNYIINPSKYWSQTSGSVITYNGTGSADYSMNYAIPGNYSIEQGFATSDDTVSLANNGPHWIFDSANCNQSHQSELSKVSLNISYGQNVNCTFNNTWYKGGGYLNIIKNTIDGIDGKFNYTISGPVNSKAAVKTSESRGISDDIKLVLGSYNITEDDSSNWNLDSATCYPPHTSATITNDPSIGTVAWQNPSAATDSDNDYAEVSLNNEISNYLKATNFGFDIPSNTEIQGVEVYIEEKIASDKNNTSVSDDRVSLVKNGNVETTNKRGGNANASFGNQSQKVDTVFKYGNSDDTWGSDLTPDDVNANDFGVVISVFGDNPNTTTSSQPQALLSAMIDQITMVVTYKTPEGIITTADSSPVSGTQAQAEILSSQTTTCVFNNSPKGILEIKTKFLGGSYGGAFDYNIYSTNPKTLSTIETTHNEPSLTKRIALKPGPYNILQTGPLSNNNSWIFDSAVCEVPDDITKEPSVLSDDPSIGTVAWQSPSSAASSNDSYATVNLSDITSQNDTTSHYLKAIGFGFNIPANATIKGVKVEIEKKATNLQDGNISDNKVSLVKNGNISPFNKAHFAEFWPDEDISSSYGSNTDLWGLTLTPAEVNRDDFGVVISAGIVKDDDSNTNSSATANIDNIKITVTYTTPATATVNNADETIDTTILDWQSTGKRTVCTFSVRGGNQCTVKP